MAVKTKARKLSTDTRENSNGLNSHGAREHPHTIKRFPVSYCSASLRQKIKKAAEKAGKPASQFVTDLLDKQL